MVYFLAQPRYFKHITTLIIPFSTHNMYGICCCKHSKCYLTYRISDYLYLLENIGDRIKWWKCTSIKYLIICYLMDLIRNADLKEPFVSGKYHRKNCYFHLDIKTFFYFPFSAWTGTNREQTPIPEDESVTKKKLNENTEKNSLASSPFLIF